MELNFM